MPRMIPTWSSADLGQQPLEARPAGDGPAAAALVLVDDGHAVRRPAQLRGAAAEVVLQVGRLAVLVDLLGAGLADVDDRQPLMVPGLDLAQAPGGGAGRSGAAPGCTGGSPGRRSHRSSCATSGPSGGGRRARVTIRPRAVSASCRAFSGSSCQRRSRRTRRVRPPGGGGELVVRCRVAWQRPSGCLGGAPGTSGPGRSSAATPTMGRSGGRIQAASWDVVCLADFDVPALEGRASPAPPSCTPPRPAASSPAPAR